MSWIPILVAAFIALVVVYQLYTWYAIRRLIGRAIPANALTDSQRGQTQTLYYFFNPHCMYCKSMTPTVQEMQRSHDNVISIDTDEFPELARQFGIGGVPALLLVNQGLITDARIGVQAKQELDRLLDAGPQQH